MKRNLVLIIGSCVLLASCGNRGEKPASETDSAVSVNETGDTTTLKVTKPAALSVTDSVKQLQEKDTAAKMIKNAPVSVSIHLDSIPEQK